MLFNSLEFAIFLPIVFLLYFALPYRNRWLFLLLASCAFYMAFIPIYIAILFLTITIDYFAAIWIERSHGRKRTTYLFFSIVSTCLVLFAFKYFNFFASNISALAKSAGSTLSIQTLQIILPIGLSFHTFQSLSYVVEVYRGHQKAETHFGIYSLYVMFFPQLVAGPIERPQNLLHQFREKHDFNYSLAVAGLRQMAWGFFKKIAIADLLAIYVNQVYGTPELYRGPALSLATVFFAFQIFCDFSGYSDIAIGSAKVLGFRLMRNFDAPYHSQSIPEFWRRWHISLSTWFRDYLYQPLGGHDKGAFIWYRNLMITFLVSGLWHGANWTYVIWGALNGLYIINSRLTRKLRDSISHLLGLQRFPVLVRTSQTLFTFSLICLSWIFFRASSVSDALYILRHLFSGFDSVIPKLISKPFPRAISEIFQLSSPFDRRSLVLSILFLVFLELGHLFENRVLSNRSFHTFPNFFRWAVYFGAVLIVLLFGTFSRNQFIYFQF